MREIGNRQSLFTLFTFRCTRQPTIEIRREWMQQSVGLSTVRVDRLDNNLRLDHVTSDSSPRCGPAPSTVNERGPHDACSNAVACDGLPVSWIYILSDRVSG